MDRINSTQQKPLADYIERIYFDNNLQLAQRSFHRPFNNGKTQGGPVLRRPGVNRILLFPGTFNPPHQGHLALLRHVFENAGDDLNIVAAIVLMTDDERVEDKTSEEDNPLVLTREQRVNLWRGTEPPFGWLWIYDKSQGAWADFRGKLERNVGRDGIQLKFMLLAGPDNIGTGGLADPRYWNVSDCITSDISRPVDFRNTNSLRQLSALTVWKKVEFDRHRLEYTVRGRMQGQSEDVIKEQVALEISRMDVSWVCHRYFKPKGMVRFIPCNLEAQPPSPPSSSMIRKLINHTPKEQLYKELSTITMNTEILIRYINQRPAAVPKKPKVRKPEKTAEDIEREAREAWNNIQW